MAAFDASLIARSEEHLVTLMKRKSWPSTNVGPMVVFCIIGAIALLLTGIYVNKALARRKASKA